MPIEAFAAWGLIKCHLILSYFSVNYQAIIPNTSIAFGHCHEIRTVLLEMVATSMILGISIEYIFQNIAFNATGNWQRLTSQAQLNN